MPLADALKAIADAFGILADVLLSDDVNSIDDKELLECFKVIQDMDGEDKAMIIKFLDLNI